MLPAPLPDFRPPDPCCYSPPRVARLPLRPLTALYASWYGLALQKPNVSGPPYGFTARRHMVLLPCRASSSFHAFLPRRLVPPSPGDGGSQTKAGSTAEYYFLVSPLSLLTPVQPHPGSAVFCEELSEAISNYLELTQVCFFLPPPAT